ncbi:MAG TPA: hypothetical protein VGF86_13995 [Candidatus Tumulicola sp.]|jgi:hypothetical protein
MASPSQDRAAGNLDAHERSIDELHHQLASIDGVDRERLHAAVQKYKAAHAAFRDDALGCMN